MLLEVENLYAGYGKIEALHGISFHVNKGEIVTLIGANGAGKSTTLKAVMRLTPPESPTVISGDIRFNGESILKTEPHHVVARLKMDLVPEGRHIFGNLTVNENLKLATWTRKDNNIQKDVDKVFELFPRLKERMHQRSDTLSGGEQQMLAVGRALMTNCSVLLLDEPSMGLSPLLMYDMFRTLKQLNSDGLTVVVVEQNARLALQVADRGYVLDTGAIVAEGTAAQLADTPEIKAAYLRQLLHRPLASLAGLRDFLASALGWSRPLPEAELGRRDVFERAPFEPARMRFDARREPDPAGARTAGEAHAAVEQRHRQVLLVHHREGPGVRQEHLQPGEPARDAAALVLREGRGTAARDGGAGMTATARIIADSVNPAGQRLTTVQVRPS